VPEVEYKSHNYEGSLVEEPQIPLDFKHVHDCSADIEKGRKPLNVLSLFSGCGGMDLGFEGGFTTFRKSINEKANPDFIDRVINEDMVLLKKNRFQTVFANDILDVAKNAWITYFSRMKKAAAEIFHTQSIVDLVKLHDSGVKVFPKNIDVVTGGFPCQDFSLSGKRNGFESHKNHKGEIIGLNDASEETRGKLYMWMKRVIEITEPNMFIAENVKGLVNLTNVKEIIQNDFSSANGNGYIVLEPQVLHAADYGVPQSRERVIFIGIKKSLLKSKALRELSAKQISAEYNPYPKPTHCFTTRSLSLASPVSLDDIFKSLPEPEASNDRSHTHYSKAKYMGAHCQGQTEIKLNGVGPTIRAEHHGNIEFRRLSKKNGGKYPTELNAGLKERRLTPRECALIQTFPDDYDFVIENKNGKKRSFLVSTSQAYKIIGNAVPPLLAYHIARRVEQVWDLYFKKK
jgi:DNA (cytosine-5)-methyltransferase 1